MDKKVLITAGNTQVPIDKVRSIGNIFTGRTGAAIARYFAKQGCDVTILTSSPRLVRPYSRLRVERYKTYDDLLRAMERLIKGEQWDVIIHSSAVSDYKVEGIYYQVNDTVQVDGREMMEMAKLDSSGKVGSDHPELWMKLVPTLKIIDLIREPWGFEGTLVKFKLQVGMDDKELIEIATKSMMHSDADFIVANTLEGLNAKAFIISADGGELVCVRRDKLPAALYKRLGLS